MAAIFMKDRSSDCSVRINLYETTNILVLFCDHTTYLFCFVAKQVAGLLAAFDGPPKKLENH